MGFFLVTFFLLAAFLDAAGFLADFLTGRFLAAVFFVAFFLAAVFLTRFLAAAFFGCWLFSSCLLFPLGPSRYHWDNFCKLERARGAFSRGLEKSTFLHAAGKCSLQMRVRS